MILLFTSGVGILTIIVGIFLCKKLRELYKDMSFSLSFIPYERLINDEQTVFLIKKYIKQ